MPVDNGVSFYARPYVQGCAHGVLRHASNAATAHSILMMSTADIDSLRQLPAGFIVIDGAPFSHAMVKLLETGLPVVIVSKQQAENLQTGRITSIDGTSGLVEQSLQLTNTHNADVIENLVSHTQTLDGVSVHLYSSVSNIEAVKRSVLNGAEAVGLDLVEVSPNSRPAKSAHCPDC